MAGRGDAYVALSRSRRSSHWAEESKILFTECLKQAQELEGAEAQKQTALDHYMRRRNSLDIVLQESRGASFQDQPLALLRLAFSSGLAGVAFGGLLLLVGIVFAFRAQRPSSQAMALPLQEILQCAEAAAAGDVSNLPSQLGGQDEVGRLGRAVGRLISVLARSENLVYHLAALVESSGDAIISYTLEGTVLSWNKGAQRIYGYSAEEMKGRSIMLLTSEEGGGDMRSRLQRVCQGERIAPFEAIHQARNGRTVRALVRMSAILDSTRKVIGASFCAQDLTDVPLLPTQPIEGKQPV